jgi:hypothetical protein
MTSIRQFIPFESMTRGDQAAHMAEEHDLDPEPVTADELLAEHVVEHQSPRDHAHRLVIGPARPEDTSVIAALHEAESGLASQGQPEPGADDQDQGDGQAEGSGEKTFNRSKLVCDCSPERSIRVSPRQAARGPILCGICNGEFHPDDSNGPS